MNCNKQKKKPVLSLDDYNFVLYHDPCADGMCAAFNAILSMDRNSIACNIPDGIEFIGVNYNQDYTDTFEKIAGGRVLVVDFSFKPEAMQKLRCSLDSLVVIDHHKTAKKDLENISGFTVHTGDFSEFEKIEDFMIFFDMKRSGAGLVSDLFGMKRSLLTNYIEDRDLWNWDYHDSKEINIALQESMDLGISRESVQQWYQKMILLESEAGFNSVVLEGKYFQEKREYCYSQIFKFGKIVDFRVAPDSDRTCKAFVFSNGVSTFISETCNYVLEQLGEKVDIAVNCFIPSSGSMSLSLRSHPDFDCSEISKAYGGGGHKNASGCKVDPKNLPWE